MAPPRVGSTEAVGRGGLAQAVRRGRAVGVGMGSGVVMPAATVAVQREAGVVVVRTRTRRVG